ncbi:MAG: response regulator, partial [Spirochaetia bacterium]|nr:response regulator [Spirochaetia bacterium]
MTKKSDHEENQQGNTRMSAILVIDDEPGIRTTVKDILEDEGHRAFSAEDGPAGLELLKRERVDVVLLDV